MSLPAERLIDLINNTPGSPITATDVPDELKIDMAGLRALSIEMSERIGQNINARTNSVISASQTSVH